MSDVEAEQQRREEDERLDTAEEPNDEVCTRQSHKHASIVASSTFYFQILCASLNPYMRDNNIY